MSLYRLLENPAVYRASQTVLAPGMDAILTRELGKMVAGIPSDAKALDVGCGPVSWLWKFGMKPAGLDILHSYTTRFLARGGSCVTASAAAIPFASDSFDLVFSYALLHHLPDELAQQTVGEMIRVVKPKGSVIIFDPVLPRAAWRRPIAWALCKLDRGHFIRPQPVLEAKILGGSGRANTRRVTHSYLGKEGVLCRLKK